jgi:hypothetical protein
MTDQPIDDREDAEPDQAEEPENEPAGTGEESLPDE